MFFKNANLKRMKFFKNLGKILERALFFIAISSFFIETVFFYTGLGNDLVSLCVLGSVVYIWSFYHVFKNDIQNVIMKSIFLSLLMADLVFYLVNWSVLIVKVISSSFLGIVVIGVISFLIFFSLLIVDYYCVKRTDWFEAEEN